MTCQLARCGIETRPVSDQRGRIVGALWATSGTMCDDCLALKLSLSRNDVLATVRALEAEEPPALVVFPGVCSLCGRVQRVMQAWVEPPPVPKGDPRG